MSDVWKLFHSGINVDAYSLVALDILASSQVTHGIDK